MTAASLADNLFSSYDMPRGRGAQWAQIATRTIYFGHQSVGTDILSGVHYWNDQLTLRLRLLQAYDAATVSGPGLVHFAAGQNRDFASKNAAILRFLASRPRPDGAIVLWKYCYVDIDSGTDVESLFEEYRATVAAIAADHPDVTVVHTTVPLTNTVESAFKARAKHFLGRDTLRAAAVARHTYNNFIRTEYADREPLFDIAKAESTRTDGARASFALAGANIETLAAEYTSDGGHLNAHGQQVVAREFLDVIAEVVDAASPARGIDLSGSGFSRALS